MTYAALHTGGDGGNEKGSYPPRPAPPRQTSPPRAPMLIVFQSILPIFLIVLLGIALKRSPVINPTFWDGLEQFSYWVLFPSLLFQTMAHADFSNTENLSVSFAAIITVCVMSGAILGLWPLLQKAGVRAPAYSSLFQTATRWNGFVALAIAAKTSGHEGLTMIGMVMAAIIIPQNLTIIIVLVWFSGRARSYKMMFYRVVTNPMIVGTALGIAVNLLHIPVYDPVMQAVYFLSEAALSLGLITVGAGLRVMDALKPSLLALLAVFLKLAVFPVVAVAIGLTLGLHGNALTMLALSAAVPTAMNGYIMAKQFNADADFYAAVATIQVIISFFTIPVVLTITPYVAGG
jgi:malonate transporter and related proteins